MFHVNATEDRPLRARWRPVARELEQDFVLEESGQTMHFFSEPNLRVLLQDWTELGLDPVEITIGKPVRSSSRSGAASHVANPPLTSTQPK